MNNLMRLLGRKKYERMKENVRNVNEEQENMRLNSSNSRTLKKNNDVVDAFRNW